MAAPMKSIKLLLFSMKKSLHHVHNSTPRLNALVSSPCAPFCGENTLNFVELSGRAPSVPVAAAAELKNNHIHNALSSSSTLFVPSRTYFSFANGKKVFVPRTRSFRSNSRRPPSASQEKVALEEEVEDLQFIQMQRQGWLMRLSNENGFLSWCRNTYIGTILSVTVNMQAPIIHYAHEAAILFFMIAGFNIISGTSSFIFCLTTQREAIMLSRFSWLFQSSMAIIHLIVWFGAVTVYLGFADEEEEEEPTKEESEESVVKSV